MENVYLEETRPVEIKFNISKAGSAIDRGLVSGWASVSINADGSLPLDWQDDCIRPEVLEAAAVKFMANYRNSGVMHIGESEGTVVESIVFTKDKQEALGVPDGILPIGWFITVQLDPNSEAAMGVKSGKYKMFSIQGNAKRIKL